MPDLFLLVPNEINRMAITLLITDRVMVAIRTGKDDDAELIDRVLRRGVGGSW